MDGLAPFAAAAAGYTQGADISMSRLAHNALRRRVLAFAAAAIAAPLASRAASPDTPANDVSLGRVGTLRIATPTGMRRISPPYRSSAALAFGTEAADGAQLLITPMPLADAFTAEHRVQDAVEGAIRGARGPAVETEFPKLSLQGSQARGQYFGATDREPKPGEFRLMYQGAVALGAVVLLFTVLYNESAAREAKAALESVRTSQLLAGSGT